MLAFMRGAEAAERERGEAEQQRAAAAKAAEAFLTSTCLVTRLVVPQVRRPTAAEGFRGALRPARSGARRAAGGGSCRAALP